MGRFKKPQIYYILAIILISIIILLFTIKNPVSRSLDVFLNSINDSSEIFIDDYVIPEIQDDPFIDVFMDGNIIINHKILKSQKVRDNSTRIKTTLTTEHGSVDVWFALSKISDRWLITQFPKTTYIDNAVPLSAEAKDSIGVEYKMDVDGTHLYCISPSHINSISLGVPVSLIIVEDYIVLYQPMTPISLHRVMSSSEHHIEDFELGYISLESPIAIYKLLNNTPVYYENRILPIGSQDVTLYHSSWPKSKNLIAYVDPSKTPKNIIRVAINDSQFQSLIHQEIKLSSTQVLTITNVIDDIDYTIEGGDEITFKYNDNSGCQFYHESSLIGSSFERWYITPEDGGSVVVNNIKRAQVEGSSGTPYRGSFEISSYANGLILVNEVNLEEYLYSVVPSEMPIKFGLESLKVQAIASRSYAARSLDSTGYSSFGAHVDDSTSSQMYNNIKEYPIAIQAVDETRGLVPVFDGQIIDARFFSTSYGYSANFHETWSVKDVFPSSEIPYLAAKPQFIGDATSLYNEENFRSFIKQKNLEGYDRYSPFFRWSLTMKREQIEAIIQRYLPILQKSQPSFVLTRDNEGSFSQQPIPDELGQLQNITPISRGHAGNIMELEITTTSGIYRIIKELNIRQLLKPVNLLPHEEPIEIKRYDGSIIKDFSILPSAFFYMDIARDNNGIISHVSFSGGGYGHGVGMSQYGAYGLSLLGKSYREIIEHFYPGTNLEKLF